MRRHGEERRPSLVGHAVWHSDREGDLANSRRPLCHCELSAHGQAIGGQIVADEEPSGVEGDARCQADDEQFRRRGRGISSPFIDWLIGMQHVMTDDDFEEITAFVVDANEVVHRSGEVDVAAGDRAVELPDGDDVLDPGDELVLL